MGILQLDRLRENVAANPKELQITTVTHVLGVGQGRSWVEGDVQVYGVLPAQRNEFVAKGVCENVTQQVFVLSCRSSNCASGVEHGNPTAAGPTTPSIVEGL